MEQRVQTQYFLAPSKKGVKRVPKRVNLDFWKNCQKISKFEFSPKSRYIVPLLPFFTFFDKKWVRKHIFYFHPIFRPKNTHLKPKKYHFLKFWKNQKWPFSTILDPLPKTRPSGELRGRQHISLAVIQKKTILVYILGFSEV